MGTYFCQQPQPQKQRKSRTGQPYKSSNVTFNPNSLSIPNPSLSPNTSPHLSPNFPSLSVPSSNLNPSNSNTLFLSLRKSQNIQNIQSLGRKKYIPCRYLGKGIYGTTIEVMCRDGGNSGNLAMSMGTGMGMGYGGANGKKERFAQKIMKTNYLMENYLFLDQGKFRVINSWEEFMNVKEIYIQGQKIYYLGDLFYFSKKYPKKLTCQFLIELTIRLVIILQKLHQQSLIYRNLRPQNILFTSSEGNFQLSQLMFCINADRGWSYFGAATYTPPEVYAGASGGNVNGEKEGTYGKEIDYWMLGVMLYEILVGCTPFQGANLATIKQNVMGFHVDMLKFPQEISIHEELTDFITKLLQPEPQNRITLDQIKRHRLFHGQSWDSARQNSETLLKIKSNADKDQSPLPNRIIYTDLRRSRPLTRYFQIGNFFTAQ